MTVTAPLITEELVIEADGLIVGDNLPVVIPDAAPIVDEYSMLRDPVVPFLVIGLATLMAMIVLAYLLTAPLA